ncbi:MAG: YeeE/YedE family protein, partial [Chloroflexi bacterium]|nr:YeeE/YedE family protein [Chloroflexota bacterium]
MPEQQWTEVFGPSRVKRALFVFFGAALLEIAAGIAGGCTSGLAISGGMLLAPAAYLFIAGMFASGIVTALIVYRRRY